MNSFLLHLLSPHPSVWGSVPRPQPRQGSGRLTLQKYSKSEHGLPLRGKKVKMLKCEDVNAPFNT